MRDAHDCQLQHAVQVPTSEAAALELCLFFAHALATNRRFTMCWVDHLALFVDLSWPLAFAELALQSRVAFDDANALAEDLQDCAATLNMSVALHAAPMRIIITRL